MTVRRAALAVAGACALAVACSSDDEHRIRWTTLAPLPERATLESTRLSLPVGTAIAARPGVFDADGLEIDCNPTATSMDPDILQVDKADRGAFAFSGVSAGETTIIVECGTDTLEVAARVTK